MMTLGWITVVCLWISFTSSEQEFDPSTSEFFHASRLITARIRSMEQGNVFTRVCHSVHSGVST